MKPLDEAQLGTLQAALRRAAEASDLGELLDEVAGGAIDLVNGDHARLRLATLDDSPDRYAHRHRRGLGRAPTNQRLLDPILADTLDDAKANIGMASATPEPDFPFLCVPLPAHKRTLGAICVARLAGADPFTPVDLMLLVWFGDQIALQIAVMQKNEHLRTKLERRSRELQAALKKLDRGWHEAVEANKLRTTFVANLTHDLRSPMAVVTEGLALIESERLGPLTDEQSRWLERIRIAAQHVVDLTEDLGSLARLEIGEMVLQPEPTDLAKFLRTIYDVGQGLGWKADMRFELDLPDSLPYMMIDPVRIRQVILNLVNNARKYTASGFVRLYAIEKTAPRCVIVGVRDSGDGIPAGQIEKVFQRYYQVDPDRHRDQIATGLGLAICRELIELHGGRIWVESELGQGADFKFSLPVLPMDPAIADLIQPK